MPKIANNEMNKSNLGTYIFNYVNNPSMCAINVSHDTYSIKLQERRAFICRIDTEQSVTFGFQPGKGLIRINNETGATEKNNILSEFINLNPDNPKSVKRFFEENGFIFNIPYYASATITESDFFKLVTRLKAAVELASQLSDITRQTDERLVTLILYFIYNSDIKISLESRIKTIEIGEHPILKELNSYTNSNYIDSSLEIYDENYSYTSKYIDPIFGETEFSLNKFYNSYKNNEHSRKYHTICLYLTEKNNKENYRLGFSFLKALEDKFGSFSGADYDKINFYKKDTKIILDDQLKQAAIKLGKMVLSHEINTFIKNIKPVYNFDSLEPSWDVDCLLSALYFSLFYLKPGIELIRKCENPNCNNYFYVKTSARRNKYCCYECANAVAQSRFRARHAK